MVIGLVLTVFLSQSHAFTGFILSLLPYKSVVAAAAGVLFVTSFTAPIGGLILSQLIPHFQFYQLVLISGITAVIADLAILHFLNEELLEEIEDIFNEFHGKKLSSIFHSRLFRWTLPLLVIFIIATPLPDDLAVGLLGISRVSPHRFAASSYIINTLGILGMISLFLLIHR